MSESVSEADSDSDTNFFETSDSDMDSDTGKGMTSDSDTGSDTRMSANLGHGFGLGHDFGHDFRHELNELHKMNVFRINGPIMDRIPEFRGHLCLMEHL